MRLDVIVASGNSWATGRLLVLASVHLCLCVYVCESVHGAFYLLDNRRSTAVIAPLTHTKLCTTCHLRQCVLLQEATEALV